jgi:hypothetical protein
MMPGPQYMQPPPMVEAHMQTQLAPDNIGRGSRIRKHPGMDQVMQGRTAAGRKPYTLRVKEGGEIASRREPRQKCLGRRYEDKCPPDVGHECFILEGAISRCHSRVKGIP